MDYTKIKMLSAEQWVSIHKNKASQRVMFDFRTGKWLNWDFFMLDKKFIAIENLKRLGIRK